MQQVLNSDDDHHRFALIQGNSHTADTRNRRTSSVLAYNCVECGYVTVSDALFVTMMLSIGIRLAQNYRRRKNV